MLSSSPKLGTSFGVMGAYLHYFDERSQPSLFGATAQYTSTDSTIGGVFANTSFQADHHRAVAFVIGGVIKNDYADFLGTGQPLRTRDDLRVIGGRYLYRVKDDWFAGLQAVNTNYLIIGETALDDQVLQILGLTGYRSTGIGAVVSRDTRDNTNGPKAGWVLNVSSLSYREAFGGADDFDSYRADVKGYWSHGEGHVLALRQANAWTVDAPSSAYASVSLRGYKRGQYLGKYLSSLEAEERVHIAGSWGATVFAGLAFLYGNGQSFGDSADRYPNYGAGIQYLLKPKERIVLNLEYAEGKADNYGVYLKMGYGY